MVLNFKFLFCVVMIVQRHLNNFMCRKLIKKLEKGCWCINITNEFTIIKNIVAQKTLLWRG